MFFGLSSVYLLICVLFVFPYEKITSLLWTVCPIEKGIRIECPYSWLWLCTLTTLSGIPSRMPRNIFLTSGGGVSQLFHLINFRLNINSDYHYKFKIIVINIENNFFWEKSTKRFWLYYSTKVEVEYISALSRIPFRFVQLYGPKGQILTIS